MEALHERARVAYPERWAPNGEALAGYPGASWEERLVAWQFGQAMADERASADEEPEIPDVEETRDDEQPYARARGEA